MVFWFQGAPQLTENYLDSKKVINHKLLALLAWLQCVLCMLSICHLHVSHNAPYLPHKISHKHCFNFSWDGCNTQEKWNTRVMQNFEGLIRCIMGDVQVVNTMNLWRQLGLAVRVLDLQFGGSDFKSLPDCYLILFSVVPSSNLRALKFRVRKTSTLYSN